MPATRRGIGELPPPVSTEVDREAVKMIGDWIRGLPAGGRQSARRVAQ